MNKKEKISVLISIVLISLLAIGAVSAADDVAVDDDLGLSAVDEIQAVDDTQINDKIIQEPDIVEETQAMEGDSPTTGDDTLRDEPTKTFTQLIADIGDDASEVTLEGNYVFDPSVDNNYPIIRRNLIINGPATIDGNGLTRLLAVTGGATLTLKDLTLINGNQARGYGGGVFAQNANLNIEGCTFKDNNAASYGAVFTYGTSSLKVKDSVFEGNTAGDGSAITSYGNSLEVINCDFLDCTATNNGGAIYTLSGANTKISGCNFISNEGSIGAAIAVSGTDPIIENSVFKGNIATSGSAIYVDAVNARISNCLFDSNIASNYAVVYLVNFVGAEVNSELSKCIFVNNSALRGSAITSYQNNFVVEESIFLDNIATEELNSTQSPMATDIYLMDNELPITYSINNIWFGNTADNYTASLQTYNKSFEKWQGFANVHVGNWYFLDLEATTGSSYYDLLISLNNLYTNDTGEVTKVTDCALPDWNVSLSATKGTVTPTQVTLENGIAHAQYELTAAQGPATITANALGPKVSKELPGISVKENVVVTTSSETVTVSYPETGSITITASAPGTYTVHVGENVYPAVIETAGGSATVTVPKLPVGSYDVSVTAPETEEYNAVDTGKIATYTVNKGTVTITSANVTVTYPNTNSVTITASAAGEYTVTVGDKTSSAVIDEDGGTATVTVPKLDVGDYGISVSGSAGDNYSPIDTGIINYYHVLAGSINVSGQGTTVTYPDKGTIVITTDVAGTYTIKVGDKTYENVELNAGANDFNVPDELNADDYDIKVSASIPNYEAITDKSIATYTVNKADSTVAVDSISFTYGSSGTATASLTGAETVLATIEGFENAVSVNGNVITVSGLPANANAYTMVVTTVPDANHNAASINVAVTVNKADATVTLTADKTEILFGQSATLDAVVSPEGATGDVTYYVNDEPITGNVLSDVAVGTYTVVAKYAGNENYNPADSNIVTITVDQVAPIVSVSADPVKYGVNGDVVVTVTGVNDVPLQGITVKVKVNGKEYSDITADNGEVHLLIDILPVSEYTITVDTVASGNYGAGHNYDKSLEVIKGDLTITAATSASSVDYGNPIVFTYDIDNPAGTTTAGKISYIVDGAPIDSSSISTLAAGSHTVVAKYTDDPNFNDAQSEAVEFTVNPVASTVSVDPISFTYGGSTTAEATLTGATGLTATIEGFENAVTVNGNVITVSGLPANTYTMVVTTVPDANHIAASINVEVTVNKADATLTLTADKYEITFGESVTLDAALSPSDATGPITYYVDGVEVESKVLSNLAAGVRVVTAKYAGDENYNEAVGGPTTITVNKAPSTVKVDPINFAYGAVGTATATLTGATDFTATIDGYPNAVTINGNEITVSGLPSGSYTMVVTTVPDANHTEATINVPVGVGKEDATVALSADKEVIDFGETVTLDAVVSPEDATGPITYYVNDELVDSNVLSGLAAGTYTVYAQYAGDENYNAANSNSISITVNKVASTVAVDPISFTYGGSTTAEATLTGADTVTATIAGYPNAVSVAGAVITVSDLPAGNYIMVVTTVPDASHTEASINVAVTVEKATPAISISSSKDAFAYGEDVVLNVAVMDGETGVTGSAIVTIGDNKYLVDVTGGSGKLTVKGLSNGTYEATAKFLANDNYNAAEALEPASIVISASTDAVITASVSEPSADGEATLTVNVVDGAGNPVTGKVNVTIGDGEPKEYPVTDGAASIPLTGLTLGENTIVVSTNDYTADPVSLTAVVPPKNTAEVSVRTEDGSIVIEAKDGSTPLSGTATVVIDGGEPITVPVDDSGKATVPMDGLAPGQHTVEVTFANDNYEPVSEVATISVPKGTPTVSISASKNEFAYGEDVVLNVAVMDGETGVAGTVIVTVGGNDYAVTVGADGTGQAVIKGLADNSYQATAKFVGNDNYEEASAASAASFVVNAPPEKLVPTLSITVDPVSIKESESATIKVSLVYEDTKLDGIVIVSIDGTDYAVNVVDGEGSITVNNLDPNTYPIKGEFIGDDVYAKVSVDDQTLEVTKVAKVTLNVTSEGANIVIKLTDEDNNPVTGKVNVTIDGSTKEVDVNNGVATVPIGEGNHNVTVSYPGDDIHTGAQSVSNIVYVKKSSAQKIKTQIVVNKNQTITYNKKLDNRSNYYVYATLKDANGNILAGKTVTFFAHKKLYVTKTNSKGQFRFCIAHVGYGECTHALTFVGDEDYEESFAVVCVTIKKQKVKLTSKARTFKATKKVKKLTATLKNSKGKAIAGKKITFVVNGKKYTAKTNSKGVATVKIKVTKKKTYKVKVTFAGDKTYAKKTVNRKLKIT